MSSIEVRPFRRGDCEQLSHLVNVHAAAVIPRMSASVNTVLSQLEREPGEPIVDAWVIERATLVTAQRHRVVAAAHPLRLPTMSAPLQPRLTGTCRHCSGRRAGPNAVLPSKNAQARQRGVFAGDFELDRGSVQSHGQSITSLALRGNTS
jgi:hypothetical protein